MYAVTDGFFGTEQWIRRNRTRVILFIISHNFLVHNMCRIPGSDGTFTIVKGGMGAIINDLQKLAV
jgi:hypothetical protein